ncbi:Uu.00g046110.m01.CDS01 [Anthostomella pinea]|uniref:Uu.00g046110.m01.CDS01 n=1 Tax=Anthostomella pinea TaxID=933095 RepID=A0AAI8V686_9PEZI|nr:Uu.00g046110.m01.CDS01 [Anthostomella pinea]
MGALSWNALRSREGRNSKLPLYEKLTSPSKERDSNDSYDDSDYDEYSTISSPSTTNSRNTSTSSAALGRPSMSKQKNFAMPHKPGRPLFYRLPNKIVRYLCFGLISFMLLLIFTLIRASHNENRAIAEGKIERPPSGPQIWESYSFLTRYYGGIRNLVPFSQNIPEYPRAEDELPLDKLAFVTNSQESEVLKRGLPASKEFIGYPQSVFKAAPEEFNECFIDKENKVRVPPIRYYDGRPNGFPEAILGSYGLLGLPEDICFERYGRYGPYGFGYSVRAGGLGTGEHGEKEGSESTWGKVPQVEWKNLNWAEIQRRCYQANAARYKALPPRQPTPHGFFIDDATASMNLNARDTMLDETLESSAAEETVTEKNEPLQSSAAVETVKEKNVGPAAGAKITGKPKSRTAVVIRCWDEYTWREEDVMNLRSLISELALATGGRYDIHLLVQVKNDAAHPIWADADTYQRRIEESIPAEFRGLVTLWTETQMLALYQGIFDLFARGPDLPVHGVYRGLQMAMQYFAYQHPEYDYYWQWEMDIRYTSHYYDFFSKIENWTKEQPRKGLWERNARFYLPSVHGEWDDFKQMARVQAEMGTKGADNVWEGVAANGRKPVSGRGDKVIWGPERPKDPNDWFEPDNDPMPETTYEKDKYVWGAGEQADYITFNPMFDPEGTTWGLSDDITGYNTSDGNGHPPRRAQIITASRMSRRLLMTMHSETAFKKHHAFPEMWPATVALQHGYKAVFVPHPIYVDREWPTEVFAQTLNNGKNGASGGSRTSVFGQREHNLVGLSWFYNSGFAPNMYRRWLGLKVNNDGGEEFELVEDESKNGTSVNQMRGGEGRMCLPPMLLHPVKDVELPVEQAPEVVEIPESDPGA